MNLSKYRLTVGPDLRPECYVWAILLAIVSLIGYAVWRGGKALIAYVEVNGMSRDLTGCLALFGIVGIFMLVVHFFVPTGALSKSKED